MRNILEKTTSINIIIYDKETYILKKSIFEVNFKKPVFIYIRKKYTTITNVAQFYRTVKRICTFSVCFDTI